MGARWDGAGDTGHSTGPWGPTDAKKGRAGRGRRPGNASRRTFSHARAVRGRGRPPRRRPAPSAHGRQRLPPPPLRRAEALGPAAAPAGGGGDETAGPARPRSRSGGRCCPRPAAPRRSQNKSPRRGGGGRQRAAGRAAGRALAALRGRTGPALPCAELSPPRPPLPARRAPRGPPSDQPRPSEGREVSVGCDKSRDGALPERCKCVALLHSEALSQLARGCVVQKPPPRKVSRVGPSRVREGGTGRIPVAEGWKCVIRWAARRTPSPEHRHVCCSKQFLRATAENASMELLEVEWEAQTAADIQRGQPGPGKSRSPSHTALRSGPNKPRAAKESSRAAGRNAAAMGERGSGAEQRPAEPRGAEEAVGANESRRDGGGRRGKGVRGEEEAAGERTGGIPGAFR